MIKKLIFSAAIAAVLLLLYSCPSPGGGSKDIVTITDMTTHYRVVIDAVGRSHYEIGQDYARKTLQILPEWEALVDLYIWEMVTGGFDYNELIIRTNNIKTQIPQDYLDELEGFYSMLSGTVDNNAGDGKISKAELYIMNLIPDIIEYSQCSAVSVFGGLSDTGSTITGRNLDWYGGFANQFPQLQAVIIIKNGSQSICLIGCLGFMGAITAINDNGIFAGILLSPLPGYDSIGKNSYPFDIRYALESYTLLDDVSSYLTFADRDYTFGHLVFLSDSTASKVVENDISDDLHRKVRVEGSQLNAGINWTAPANSIGDVNSFVLLDNANNHTGSVDNTTRWSSLITGVTNSAGGGVTVTELKEIISFYSGVDPGDEDGDIYNSSTQQCIIFQPATLTLEIYFRARDGSLADDPLFETIALSF